MGLSVAVRVLGHDPDGTAWEEMTATDNASLGGASFPLKHAHVVGQVLYISSPLPRIFRRYDLAEQSYRIYAIIRNTRAGTGAVRVAGVMFIGKVPPKGYEAKPGGRYRLPDDPITGPVQRGERRRRERMQLFVNLRLRRLGADGPLEEQTVTENVCRGGARVPTTLPVAAGDAASSKRRRRTSRAWSSVTSPSSIARAITRSALAPSIVTRHPRTRPSGGR